MADIVNTRLARNVLVDAVDVSRFIDDIERQLVPFMNRMRSDVVPELNRLSGQDTIADEREATGVTVLEMRTLMTRLAALEQFIVDNKPDPVAPQTRPVMTPGSALS